MFEPGGEFMTAFFFVLIVVSVLFGLSQLMLTGQLLGRWIGRGGLDVPDRPRSDDPLESRQQHNEEVRQLLAAIGNHHPAGCDQASSDPDGLMLGDLAVETERPDSPATGEPAPPQASL